MPDGMISIRKDSTIYLPSGMRIDGPRANWSICDGDLMLWATDLPGFPAVTRMSGSARTIWGRDILGIKKPEPGYYAAEMIDDVVCVDLEGGPIDMTV